MDTGYITPPAKRRRVLAVQPPLTKLSDLMAAFGAQRTPSSISKMQQHSVGHDARAAPAINYYESEASTPNQTPGSASSFEQASSQTSPVTNSREDSEDDLQRPVEADTSEDELQSSGIEVAPHRAGTRNLPVRSTRTQVSYARPVVKKKTAGRKKSTKLLLSDTMSSKNRAPSAGLVQTERHKIRQAILEQTKPRRDAFLLEHQDYFIPLLPDRSYIHKLQQNQPSTSIVKYQLLARQPEAVQATMKPYQLAGLSFLVYMHQNGMSCILGDEMGLGKTLQTLSLFQYLDETQPISGEARPHLVVCPLSVLSSWMNESRKWVPKLKVIQFHGTKQERERFKKDVTARQHHKDAERIDIMVTTYETFAAEQSWLKRAFAWRYCVLDEGHKIKNEASGVASALQSLQAEYRLLLTGTPLQNNLKEMWALLHWLFPDVFSSNTQDEFKDAFDLTKGKVSTSFMDHSRRLLELIMLRRMKDSAGVNLGLPPKEEVTLFVPLTPMQKFWYQRLLTKADNALLRDLFQDAKAKEASSIKQDAELALLERGAVAVDAMASAKSADVWAESMEIMERAVTQEDDDKGSTEWKKLMHLLMQLRKICNHPYLIREAGPDPYYVGDHVKLASGKFIVLDKLLDELVITKKKKVLIFSGFTSTLNLCEDLLALKGAGSRKGAFDFARLDGSTARARRNLAIRMFNDPASDFRVMLISTRAGGLGVNLASATEVIFLDEDWNPQITLQAEARAHRIGQTQKVTVYKIITQGTVEEQMGGRIRKKLYLSAKITESMRNIHGADPQANSKKRKLEDDQQGNDDAPQLGTSQLKSLLRKGAQTLVRPQIDVTEMLGWSFSDLIEKCKDKADERLIGDNADVSANEVDEKEWLSSMEKVETAIFEGKRLQKAEEKAAALNLELSRADRRVNKNTTVLVDGFEISKESMLCGEWEAVPTFAGKDSRLAEPVREKRKEIINQEHCQHCWDGGEIYQCTGCPRSYHYDCMTKEFKAKTRSKMNTFYCSQHECKDCGAKTAEAGGMIYRCRWCENGYCEDCLDFDRANMVGATLPELELLDFGALHQAWWIECPECIMHWEQNPQDRNVIQEERLRIEKQYNEHFSNAEAPKKTSKKSPQKRSPKASVKSSKSSMQDLAETIDLVSDDDGDDIVVVDMVDRSKKRKVPKKPRFS